jgi:hypothetical protein
LSRGRLLPPSCGSQAGLVSVLRHQDPVGGALWRHDAVTATAATAATATTMTAASASCSKPVPGTLRREIPHQGVARQRTSCHGSSATT